MLEAMYGIEFTSNVNNSGYGIAILETGKVLGGDSSFVFVGNYEIVNHAVKASIKCTNDRNLLPSIFGDIKEFNLALEGTPDPQHKEFTLRGYMLENPSMKIGVKLTRRAELP